MSNHNRERIIGSSILLGGALLLSAVFYRVNYINKSPNDAVQADVVTPETSVVAAIQPKQDNVTLRELTADYETEQRILAEKKRERAKRVAEQEKLVNEYLQVQEQANAKALKKADKEFDTGNTKAVTQEQSAHKLPKDVLNTIPEVVHVDAQKSQAEAKREAERLAQQKAQARLEKEQQAQQRKQRLAEEKRQQALAAAKRERDAKKAKEKEARIAKQKLKDARAKALMEGDTKEYGVQVALASNQAAADNMVTKLRKQGYKVTTSQTSRGVRVIVGPEKGKRAALALKDKVNADARLGVQGAWVMDVSPRELKAKRRDFLAQNTKKAETKAQKNKQKEAEAAAKKAKEQKTRYGVQVAMAGTSEDAERLITKLKKHGYKVTTSNTTRGTRIIVGANLKKEEALKMQAKVNADSRVNVSGAWIRRER